MYQTTCPECKGTSAVQGIHANGQRIWRCPCGHEWSANPAYPLPTPSESSQSESPPSPSEPAPTSGESYRDKRNRQITEEARTAYAYEEAWWQKRPDYTPAEEAEIDAIAAKWANDPKRLGDEVTKWQLRRDRKIGDEGYKKYGNKPFAQYGCLYWLAILLGGVAGFIIAVLIGWFFWNPGAGFVLAGSVGIWVGFGVAYNWVDSLWGQF